MLRRHGLLPICALLIAIAGTPARAGGAAPHAQAPTGPKKTIAVGMFEASEIMGGAATGQSLSALLTDALVKDGRFVVVEQIAVADVQAQRQTGQNATRPHHVIGASILVRGSVTKFDPGASGGGLSVGGIGGFGNALGVTSQTAVCEIMLRFIDTSTGQVIATSTARGTASGRHVLVAHQGNSTSLEAEIAHQTPLGQAAQDAIRDAVKKVSLQMRKVPWSALVVETDGNDVFINAGANRNMRAGTALRVYRKTRVLTDPATGAVIDTFFATVGSITVETVRNRTSIAAITSGTSPKRGDVVKLH